MLRAMIASVVQMTSGPEVARNLSRAAELIELAARRGAELVALPENFALMRDAAAPGPNPHAQAVPDGEVVRFLRERAAAHRIVLAGGTFPERDRGRRAGLQHLDRDRSQRRACSRATARSTCSTSTCPARCYRESANVAPGSEVVVAEARATARSGLSVCYDVRFPELYRALVDSRRDACCSCPPRSRCRPAATTGRSCCARARSRASAS